MENEKRLHRCCFTGHRPEKLSLSENEVKHLLEKAIDNAIADGYVTFITGMAKGTDIWAAEIVLEKKSGMTLCASSVPYRTPTLRNGVDSLKNGGITAY
ncbi:MAG: hypothetical protein ACLUO6_12150 [Ruminococcus sp.]